MVNKKFLLFGLLLLLFSSFISALTLDDDALIYGAFTIDSSNQINSVSGFYNGTVTGATYDASGFITSDYSYDGTDLISYGDLNSIIVYNKNWTISVWVNQATGITSLVEILGWWSATKRMPLSKFASDHGSFPDKADLLIYDGTNVLEVTSTTDIADGTYHNIIITYNRISGTNSEIKMFVDGVQEGGTQSGTMNDFGFSADYIIGSQTGGSSTNFVGNLDEHMIYANRTLTPTEASDLFDENVLGNQYPFSTIEEVNESLESTFEASQIGSLASGSTNFQNILDVNFNISDNDTNLWVEVVGQIESNSANSAECRVLVDDVDTFDSLITRDNDGLGLLGNLEVMTTNFTKDEGSVNLKYQCRRSSGVGSITYSNSELVTHILMDESGRDINHLTTNLLVSTSSGVLSEVGSYLFTVSNLSVSNTEGAVSNLVVNWRAEYTNNAVSSELLNSMLSINGTNCSIYPRTVDTLKTGSVAGICNLNNVTVNSTLNISLFASGSNADFDFLIQSSEFFTHLPQVGGISLTDINITSASLTKIAEFPGGNTDHALANVYVKGGFPVNSSSLTTSSFQFRLINSVNLTSVTNSRDINTNVGVGILQHVFNDVPVGNYTIELWASCTNSDCKLQGGDVVSYVTDVTTFFFNSYNVTTFNIWNNNSILLFNVTDSSGTTTSSINGTANLFSLLNFDNLTVSSPLYFSSSFINHNTSQDLNVFLKQSIINFSSLELVTGDSLLANYSVDGIVDDNFFLSAGFHNVTASKFGYFNLTQEINVVPLQNGTVSIDGLYNLLTNLSVFNILDSSPIINFSGSYVNVPNLFSDTFNSITGFVFLPMIQGLPFNVQLDTILGFASSNNFFNLSSFNTTGVSNLNINISLFTNNSISFSIFNLSDLIFMSQDVNVSLVGSTITVDAVTSNGSLYLDNLNDDSYTITFSSSGFDDTVLFVTVEDSSHQFVNSYMSDSKDSKIFTVVSDFGNSISDATLSFLQNVNGSLITVAQGMTDFSGVAEVFLDPNVEYSFFVTADGFDTFTGTIIPIANSFTVTLTTSGIDRFISVFEDIIYFTSFTYVPNSSFVNVSLVINSASGSLLFYGFNTSYLGNNFSVLTSGVPVGGVEVLSISGIDNSLQNTLLVEFFFRSTLTSEIFFWNSTIFLSDIVPTNITLTNGLFDDLVDLPTTNPIRGMIPFIIVVFLILFLSSVSGSMTIGAIGGLAGLGLISSFGFLPTQLVLVSMIAITFIIVADVSSGGFR